jgi:hypothetical protein
MFNVDMGDPVHARRGVWAAHQNQIGLEIPAQIAPSLARQQRPRSLPAHLLRVETLTGPMTSSSSPGELPPSTLTHGGARSPSATHNSLLWVLRRSSRSPASTARLCSPSDLDRLAIQGLVLTASTAFAAAEAGAVTKSVIFQQEIRAWLEEHPLWEDRPVSTSLSEEALDQPTIGG